MELADLLKARRSTRRFDTTRDIPEDVLARVLAAPLAMPHAGNTYDWRGVVLRRSERDPETWPEVFEALMRQSYVEEAAVLIAWGVQPGWWAERYRDGVQELLRRGLIEPDRAGDLLAVIQGDPDTGALTTALVGEAMMGVAAAMLVAMDAGLGATVTACRPGPLARSLGVPGDAVVCQWGVLALGWPVEEDGPAASAPKPAVGEMYFEGHWGQRLRGGVRA
ncbi:MAG: nitroreductase family protein [Actinomycetota bacterium]|nr:nitroreductase family protein [Actinomycetota bacterium]